MSDGTIRVGQTEAAYSDDGDGNTSLLLHGFTGNRHTMHDLGDLLGGRRLSVDLPGHGDTVCAEGGVGFTMSDHIDVVGSLLDARCDTGSPVDVVGYSMGARVALSFAVHRPRRVRSLTLIGGSAGLANKKDRRLRLLDDTRLAHSLHSNGIEAFIERWMSMPMWQTLEQALGPEGWQASRDQRISNSAQGLAESLIGVGTGQMPPLHDELSKLSLPVLLVVGELDEKFRAIANEMAASLPDARVKVAGGTGHAVHLERPDACASVIGSFIGPR
ncbi:MAG: alpha/beta fold hydrolase [Actinomycetia bacterium]|nr:alpha/beta fold hydrolase [Actinomycetes bacterium]MCP4957912.1 alpha/beta fold hydrolase [Actinomycetes bacterium]